MLTTTIARMKGKGSQNKLHLCTNHHLNLFPL